MTNSANQKNLYVVLGMPRSGTSAITRGLKALGISLGDHLVPAAAQFNPKGVYEDRDIVYKINRAITAELGFHWEPLREINSLCYQNAKLDALKQKAVLLLQKRMENLQHWGFKDPRATRILSFWQDVFNEMQVKTSYIIALRHPLASAYSWHKQNAVDVEYGLLLWLSYTIAAIDDTRHQNRVLVNYDLLLQNPLLQLERIKKRLAIPVVPDQKELDNYANQFLDKKLNHYDPERDERRSALLSLAPAAMQVYDLLLRVARDELSLDCDEFVSAWDEVKRAYTNVYPIYCYIDGLLKRNKEQERALRAIHKFIPPGLQRAQLMVSDFIRQIRRRPKKKFA